ncbi:MAG TPA: hypothetical protein VMJ93_03260 [Verrucomicrobiae bacterium]|nr:hypothetical protein [Verrucomicrobiae bacterium]
MTTNDRLEAIARTYIRKLRPRAQAEIDWFADRPSLEDAIEKAALAVNSRDKRYSHQRRLRKKALKQALGVLLAESAAIGKARDFEALLRIVRTVVKIIPGLGPLYVYDTSLRIGARLNLFPRRVYLHAGTRAGARALGLNYKADSLAPSVLPKEFRSLEPHELEDILCIFKGQFKALAHLRPTSNGDVSAKRAG